MKYDLIYFVFFFKQKTAYDLRISDWSSDVCSSVLDQLDDGTSLAEMAKELGVEINSSPALTADGRIYGQTNLSAAPQIMGTVETAFQMEEGEPQLAEIVPGTNFMIFEVSDITPAAAAPLKEIRPQVTLAWRLAAGSQLARKAVIGRAHV